MKLTFAMTLLLALAGCGSERHEAVFRNSDPSDFQEGAAREKELQWLLKNGDLYVGMSELDLISKIGPVGAIVTSDGVTSENTNYHSYSLGPGRQFHVWCKGGKVVEMQTGSEEKKLSLTSTCPNNPNNPSNHS